MIMVIGYVRIFVLCLVAVDLAQSCPEKCICRDCYTTEGQLTEGECKLICESEAPALSLTEVPSGIPNHVVQIDLSGNSITHVSRSAFHGLSSLIKLDLSSNRIKTIDPRAFAELGALQKLDLSGNGLKSVNSSLFEGLPELQKLELAGNELESIPEGTFDVLPNLQKVDFQSRKLVCDCRLQWVVKWQKLKNVRIRDSTVCAEPELHRGKSVKELKKKEFTCNDEIDLSYFELSPSSSQVVFEGDELPFECRAHVPDTSAHMMWIRGGQQVVANTTQGVLIHQTFSPNHAILMQSLILERLQVAHSGVWTCFIQTPRGNASKSVNIVVMSNEATYCEPVVNITSKGTYHWPKTVSLVKMSLPCESGAAAWYQGEAAASATYRCTAEGKWEDLDVDQCAYISEVTRVLEQYSSVELSNSTSVLTYMDTLVSHMTSMMDVVYTARIMETLGRQVTDNPKVADFLLATASRLMTLDDSLLQAAQAEDGSCSKVVKVIDSLPKQLLWDSSSVRKHTDNIAIQAHQVTAENFPGITCFAYRFRGMAGTPKDVYMENSFICNEGGNTSVEASTTRDGMELEASIHVPADVFRSVRCIFPLCSQGSSFSMQFIIYKNAKLFPVVTAQQSHLGSKPQSPLGSQPEIISSVISAKIVGVSVENMTSPVVTSFRTPVSIQPLSAVYWDFQANDGRGAWLSRGCQISDQSESLSMVHCSHMTHFAVSQEVVIVQTPYPSNESLLTWLQTLFKMSPAVYGGSVILTLCTMTVIITYISGHRYIRMPRKGKHAIANICLCLLLLCLTFTLGIHISEPIIACQVVGVAIHYFSLVELCWIIILAFTMHKKFMKVLHPPPPPTELEGLEDPPPPRSAITCYLIGWGVSVIICGISGAINWKEYAGQGNYCFLSLNAALLTFFVPAGILIVVIAGFLLRICCVLRPSQKPIAPLDDPETEEIQVQDANEVDGPTEDLLTTVVTPGTKVKDTGSRTTTPSTNRVDLLASNIDLEHRPISQLRGMALLLLLFVVSWACGAFAVALPFTGAIPHQAIIFNYLYGISTFALGIYILAFYCVSRRDCREAWRYCCSKPHKSHQSKMEEIPAPMNLQQLSHIRANGHIPSASSLSSLHTNKSNTVSSFNPALYSLKKPSKVNLLPSHTSDPSFTSLQEQPAGFYNPRQNGVAKKYWEKKNQRSLLSQMAKDLTGDSGHSSNTEGRGGIIYDQGRRLSYHGHSSDALTNQSLEIQIPGKNGIILDPRLGRAQSPFNTDPRYGRSQSPYNAEQIENIYNSLYQRKQLSLLSPANAQQAPITIDPVTGAPMLLTPINRSMISPVGGSCQSQGSPNTYTPLTQQYTSSSPLPPVMEGLNFIPGQSCPSSVANMPNMTSTPFNHMPYLLAVAPYACENCPPQDTGQGLECSHRPPVQEFMQRNGSVPRIRDFDGQSEISQEPNKSQITNQGLKKRLSQEPDTSKPDLFSAHPQFNPVPKPVSKSDIKDPRLLGIPLTPVSADKKLPGGKPGGKPRESESDVFSDTDPFVKEIKQRIPQKTTKPSGLVANHKKLTNGVCNSESSSKSKSPTPSREINGFTSSDGGHESQTRSGGSGAESKTSAAHSEPLGFGKQQHGPRPQRSQSLPKGDHWDDEFNSMPKKPVYAFVNHNYKDKVIEKLLKKSQESGSSLVDSGVSWLPRSVSAYEQVATETDTLVEETATSTSSDSDGDDDDIWLPNKQHKKKLSQETSV